MENEGKKLGWQTILWAIAVPVIGILGAVFVGVALVGFQWGLVGEVFRAQWILLVSVFALVFVLILLMAKHAVRVAVVGFVLVGVVLVLSSAKGSWISENLRSLIDSAFDITYMASGITVVAFAAAILAISKKEKD